MFTRSFVSCLPPRVILENVENLLRRPKYDNIRKQDHDRENDPARGEEYSWERKHDYYSSRCKRLRFSVIRIVYWRSSFLASIRHSLRLWNASAGIFSITQAARRRLRVTPASRGRVGLVLSHIAFDTSLLLESIHPCPIAGASGAAVP